MLSDGYGPGCSLVYPTDVELPSRRVSGARRQATVIDLCHLKRVVEHDREDQVISVETGMTLFELDRLLDASGQWLPISRREPDATLFDLIGDGDGGCLEHGFGGPRHLTLGLHVVTADGRLIRTGGKVVKNVTGYDMTKLFLGSRASFGIPVVAHFRLYARPERSISFLFASPDKHAICAFISKLNASGLPFSVLELLSAKLLLPHASAQGDRSGGSDGNQGEHGGGYDYNNQIDRSILLTDALYASLPDKNSLVIFAQIHAHSSVIAEVLPQLKSLASHAGHIGTLELDDATGDAVASALSSTACAVRPNVVANATLRFVENYIHHRDHQQMLLQFRAASGRLRLFPSAKLFHGTIDELKKISFEAGRTISIAYGDDEFVYRHLWHPPDSSAARITGNLKEKFDPYKRLNPAVSL